MAVLEALSDKEKALLAILSDPSGLDQAEFLWYASDHYQNCFRAWPFQHRWWRSEEPLQIDQCARCLKEDTLILTSKGFIPIQEVKPGMLVMTHRQRWRRVLGVFDRGVKSTVEISGYGHPDGIFATPDHQFWASHAVRASKPKDGHKGKKLLDPAWVRLEDWISNDGSQKMDTNWCLVGSNPEPLDPDFSLNIKGCHNYTESILSHEWMWLYGLYLAEGSSVQSGAYHRVCWSVHDSEIEEVALRLKKLGLKYFIESHESACSTIRINSKPLTIWIRRNAPGRAKDKEVAPWIFGLDRDLRECVLEGYLFGDGFSRGGTRTEASTTSRKLVFSIMILARTLGYSTSSYVVNEDGAEWTISGRSGVRSKSYAISVERGCCSKPRQVYKDGFLWGPAKVGDSPLLTRTWDLEVEEDNSFVADGIVVHNSVGKSLSIQVKACAFPILHAPHEMVITAPEGNHLQAVTDLIETRLVGTRFYRELLLKNANNGITHRPFLVKFQNGARIMGRIPQRDGKGVKGIHPLWLEMDEASDYPDAGWVEVIETLKRGHDGASWRAHGVTRGIRDYFYKFTQDDSDWFVHRYPAMMRPTWTDEERQEKIEMYGSDNHPDYRRNILGKHGDVQNPLFVLHRLLQCVDIQEGSDYNESEYTYVKVNAEVIEDRGGDIMNCIDLPMSHKKYKTTWAGMDVGMTNHPSEILVFSEEKLKKTDEETTLKLISRFRLERVSHLNQVALILWLIDFYNLRAFSMDKTGLGLPMFQHIQALVEKDPRIKNAMDTVKGYNFSAKILVDFDQSIPVEEFEGDPVSDAAIKRNVLEFASDKLREYVDSKRILLPNDRELISEFQGQTFVYDKSGMDMYGRKRFSQGSFHALDAARMAVLGQVQFGIESFIREHQKVKKAEPIFDAFMQF